MCITLIYKSEEEGVGVEKMEKRKIIPFSFFATQPSSPSKSVFGL